MDVIISATSLAAESLGLGGVVGTIGLVPSGPRRGGGNPLEDITAVRRVTFVMKAGVAIRASLTWLARRCRRGTIASVDSLITFVLFIIAWFALQTWVLPKLGVPT